MDSAVDMKKRRRLQALQKQSQQNNQAEAAQKAAETQDTEPKKGFSIAQADCDLGMSPQIMKGSVFSKKKGGGGLTSPIVHADKFKLGKR